MRQNSTSAARQRVAAFMMDPFAQAILTGAVTLIAPRDYPRWLRRGLIWGPTVAGVAGGAYLATNRGARRKLATRIAVAEQQATIAQDLRPQEPPRALRYKGNNRTVSLVVTGATIGGVASLVMAGGFWVDYKIDQGLRRLNVPFPRVVMGVATGVYTWWMLKNDPKQAALSKAQH
jgi:hypothetical protein